MSIESLNTSLIFHSVYSVVVSPALLSTWFLILGRRTSESCGNVTSHRVVCPRIVMTLMPFWFGFLEWYTGLVLVPYAFPLSFRVLPVLPKTVAMEIFSFSALPQQTGANLLILYSETIPLHYIFLLLKNDYFKLWSRYCWPAWIYSMMAAAGVPAVWMKSLFGNHWINDLISLSQPEGAYLGRRLLLFL